jgi:phage gp46-like protein
MAQDLLAKNTNAGCFDLVLGEQDFETVDGLETTVAVLLFTDARAAPEEVSEPAKRRGWVGNILRSIDLGGMLWLWSQARNTQNIRNKIERWAINSLQPLIDDGIASEVVTTVVQTDKRRIKVEIDIIVKEGETKKFSYWLDTDLGNLTNDN